MLCVGMLAVPLCGSGRGASPNAFPWITSDLVVVFGPPSRRASVVSCVKWSIWFSGIGRVDKTPKACIHRFLVDSRYALNPPYKKQHITARHIMRDATLEMLGRIDDEFDNAFKHA